MINGVINIKKEAGMTSFGVVSRLRRILGQKKIGHTGTLDPDAEGVLPVCIGRATHLVEDLSHGTKTYEALMLLGTETDTQDTSGTVLATHPVNVTEEEVKAAIFSFLGKQMQVPPMYSALKVNGQKLVDLARRGIEVERKGREVEFSDIIIHKIDLPRVDFTVTVSHGTYIRTLCYDIGRKLGCSACMEHLTRVRVEEFELADALTLQEVEERVQAGNTDFILPIDHFYEKYPALCVPAFLYKAVINGGNVPISAFSLQEEMPEESLIRLYTQKGAFVGIYQRKKDFFCLKKFFYDPEEAK